MVRVMGKKGAFGVGGGEAVVEKLPSDKHACRKLQGLRSASGVSYTRVTTLAQGRFQLVM